MGLDDLACGRSTLKLVSPAKKTVKRLVKLESLRMPFENHILTPWADENIEKIKCFCFNGGHCLTYLNQSEQADYCRSN